MPKQESLNIKKFAALCQLSVGTVSGIINNKPGFNADTIQFVRDKMREYKYQPNPYAQRMQRSAVKVISIISHVDQSFFAAYILKELVQFLHRQGYNAITHYLKPDDDFDILNVAADGYILTNNFPHILKQIHQHQLQAIVLDKSDITTKKIYHLDFDRRKAHADVVDYYIQRGHHCFGYVGEKSNKYEEFKQALRTHKLKLNYYARHVDSDYGTQMFQELKVSGQHCAFFIPFEGHALQFALQCHMHGLSIGQDLSAITWGMRYDELLPGADYTRVGCFSDSIGHQILDYLSRPLPQRRQNILLDVEFHQGATVKELT